MFDRKLFRRTLLCLSVLALPAAALRLFTYWRELNPSTGFFQGNAVLCTLYNVLGFAVFALCLLLSMKKSKKETEDSPIKTISEEKPLFAEEGVSDLSTPSPQKVRLSEFAEKSAAWQGTLSAFLTFLPGFGFLAYSLSFFATGNAENPYNLIFALLSALSGIYFVYEGICASPYQSKIRPFFALLPSFWCTLRMVIEYRDLARFVNKSLYVGQFLFIISALFFFLYRAQLLLNEKGLNRPHSYAFTALAVVFFGFTCRLPQLIAVFGDQVAVDLIDASSLVIDLAITLFAFIKIRSLLQD